MWLYLILLSYLAAISFCANLALIVHVLRLKKRVKQPVPDKTASELLTGLLAGGAVAVVQVIDPKTMFLYSPKDV